jgi:serine/threonine protein kinase
MESNSSDLLHIIPKNNTNINVDKLEENKNYSSNETIVKVMDTKYTTHLKRSVCKKILGSGGFSIVKLFQCKNECEGRKICDKLFVVKTLIRSNDQFMNLSEKEITRLCNKIFDTEFSICYNLDHPNLIKAIDMEPKSLSIIFEYNKGIDFIDILNNCVDKNTNKYLRYFDKFIDGIEYMHNNNIVHLDIKLENILLEKEVVKLIDFGTAKRITEDEMFIGRCGTEEYMPPEMHKTKYYNAKPVDIWCLGVVLYNIIYDYMPWECAKLSDVFFDAHVKYLEKYDNLNPRLFESLTVFGYSKEQELLIFKLFMGMLHPIPEKRMNIEMIKKIFYELKLN